MTDEHAGPGPAAGPHRRTPAPSRRATRARRHPETVALSGGYDPARGVRRGQAADPPDVDLHLPLPRPPRRRRTSTFFDGARRRTRRATSMPGSTTPNLQDGAGPLRRARRGGGLQPPSRAAWRRSRRPSSPTHGRATPMRPHRRRSTAARTACCNGLMADLSASARSPFRGRARSASSAMAQAAAEAAEGHRPHRPRHGRDRRRTPPPAIADIAMIVAAARRPSRDRQDGRRPDRGGGQHLPRPAASSARCEHGADLCHHLADEIRRRAQRTFSAAAISGSARPRCTPVRRLRTGLGTHLDPFSCWLAPALT